MVRFFFAFLLLSAPVLFTQDLNWYKGNLHTHSLWSDGDGFPEMIIGWYKSHGYDFIALSDHNILAKGEKWIELSKKDFDRYAEIYDTVSVEKKINGDTVLIRLKTIDEYLPLFQEEGKFLILQSEEISDRFERKPIHINANGIIEFIEPQGGGSVLEVMQNNIDAVNEQRKKTGKPMFPHVNHPNFGWAVNAEDIINLEGDKFFEVYNGHPLVNNYGDSLRPSTEEIWDMVLTARLSSGKEIMYGLAVDDAHNYLEEGLKKSNPGRGWVMVKSSELSPDSLISAMERGDFYSSTGVVLDYIDYSGEKIKISVKPEDGIEYNIQFIGNLKDYAEGKKAILLQENNSAEAEYHIMGNELYIRAVVTSSKIKINPYKEGEFEKAWIQPIKVD